MIKMEVSDPIDTIIESLRDIPKKVANPSIAKALNRVAVTARKRAVKEVKDYMNVSPALVKSMIDIRKANAKKLISVLKNRGQRLNLAQFKGRQTKKGVQASTYGITRVYKGAFLIKGGKAAMARETQARLPIRPLYGPGVISSLTRLKTYPNMSEVNAADFKKALYADINFRMGKLSLPVPERFRPIR